LSLVKSTLTVWPPGQEPLQAKPWNGHGRKPSRLNRDLEHQPVTVKELSLSLKKKAWRTLTWREGSNTPLTSRFAAARLRPASRDYNRTKLHPVEWLIVEWPNGEAEPTKYWLSTLPKDTPLQDLVDKAKLRWRIERDYEELKGELGFAHYEGRGWRGFHHHATLCIAAYGFLICAIGNGLAEFLVWKVMDIDLIRACARTIVASGILVIADQLFLFGVDREAHGLIGHQDPTLSGDPAYLPSSYLSHPAVSR
jgi:DDE superfamily endonuclease